MKEEVIDQICLGLLEGQMTLREECEKVTFDAAVAFEMSIRTPYSVLTHREEEVCIQSTQSATSDGTVRSISDKRVVLEMTIQQQALEVYLN